MTFSKAVSSFTEWGFTKQSKQVMTMQYYP